MIWALVTCLIAVVALTLRATETENLGIRILPVPGKVTIDGKTDDWDLSGGVFVAGDVERQRDKFAAWIHAMYDQDALYILARWTDETPMNNPGSVAGDMGFAGDSLQVRLIANPDGPGAPAICWVTAWRDRQARDVIDLAFPKGGGQDLADAKSKGARQAFLMNADGKGYVQELALPWKLLINGGITPKPGARIVMSVEPNIGTAANSRVSLKDLFRPGVTPDRVFTFDASGCWGFGTFVAKGHVVPQPLRLADGRELPVRMVNGEPMVDWARLSVRATPDGIVKIPLSMPQPGYVSLNILNGEGRVVRQLLSSAFLDKGSHDVPWDGLTNTSYLLPGEGVPAGAYSWKAIWHTGIGLRLVGWAHNAGRAPYDVPGGNWGGDQGNPAAVDTDGSSMYLGWTGAEAGKAVVATDLEGNVRWRHKRSGIGSASLLATGNGAVYVYDHQQGSNIVYRLNAGSGDYSPWKGHDDATLDITTLLGPILPVGHKAPVLTGMAAAAGKLFLSCRDGNVVAIVDGATGALITTIAAQGAGDLEVGPDGTLFVLSEERRVLRVDVAARSSQAIIDGLTNASAIALDTTGAIYVGLGEPANQVRVFAANGTLLRVIGRAGGRPPLGPWQPDGMRSVRGLRVDSQNHLWVMEDDETPRRISVWDAKSGRFLKEYFGSSNYGAVGGAISPLDPHVMIGQGAEWSLDPVTGRASCVGVVHRGSIGNARFGVGANGRLYLAVAGDWQSWSKVHIYERLAPGQWKLRTTLEPIIQSEKLTGVRVWSDVNDDGLVQDDEVHSYVMDLGGWISGWYMPMTQTLTFYGGVYRIGVTGYTACGAPLYDLTKAKKMPAPPDVTSRGGMGAQRGIGSEDGSVVVYNGQYGETHSDFRCFDIQTGRLKWTYPNTYVGVHGGHLAPPPQVGLIRAAYDIVGTARLPDPIGDIFVIPTDKGEWHMLTGEGFYLTKLFEGDPMNVSWPAQPLPGAVMDHAPPGMGGEDFGGSMIYTRDGQLYVQAGKTAFINLKVVGLETVKKLAEGRVTVSEPDLARARAIRERLIQNAIGTRQVIIQKATVRFTGDIRADFPMKEPLAFAKSPTAGVEASVAYDDANLYLGWAVNDDTPWVNGASEAATMYASGDTADFQLGTDPKADPSRSEAALGDLRLSIGNLKGKPTAVIFRRLAADKHPRTFYSGTVRGGYGMESVTVVASATIEVRVDATRKRYVVEAAIPLRDLGLAPMPGQRLAGDFGATHGDRSGTKTVLRTYWNNQATGQVADDVAELIMEPRNWGTLIFQ
jgi:hypothetical protein